MDCCDDSSRNAACSAPRLSRVPIGNDISPISPLEATASVLPRELTATAAVAARGRIDSRRLCQWLVAAGLLSAFVAAGGCSRWKHTPVLPVASSVALQQLVIYSDFNLPREHRLLRDLDALRGRVMQTLDLPSSHEPIHVYLFKTPRRYRAFMQEHYPDFPDRRAFFVRSDTRLSVYAPWTDRIAEDLRHEVFHGYLHATVPNVPLWLDEGLAEYFEIDAGQAGLNRGHLDQLVADLEEGSWRPNLPALAALTSVPEMQQIQYAEAWAWVHFLLHTTAERRELLQSFLQGLREETPMTALSSRLSGDTSADLGQELVAHLQDIAGKSGN